MDQNVCTGFVTSKVYLLGNVLVYYEDNTDAVAIR